MSDLNDKVLETLKCPCCFQYMTKPIYVCLSGHSICHSCWKTHICPVCKLALTDTRNFALENISLVIHYPCANEERGCYEFFKLNELGEHHQLCNFRSYVCKLNKRCFWQGPRDKLKKHFLDKHKNNVMIGPEYDYMWKHNKRDYTVYLMLAFDEMFYVHVHLRNDTVYWVVQYLGRSEDVILFYFEIQIFTDQYNDRGVKFSEICHDDVKDIEEIIDSGFCVAVPVSVLETYMNIEEVVFYKIQMKRA